MKQTEKIRHELVNQLPVAKWCLAIAGLLWLVSIWLTGFSYTNFAMLSYILFAAFIWVLALRVQHNKEPLLPFAGWILCFVVLLWIISTWIAGFSFSSLIILIIIFFATVIYKVSFKKSMNMKVVSK